MQNKYIGVIGSRSLPAIYKPKVKKAVRQLLDKGYNIATGGAMGTDAFVLQSLLELGAAKRGVVFSAWKHANQFPLAVKERVKEFISLGGRVVWGDVPFHAHRNAIVAGLLGRNIRLVANVAGIVAFMHGNSRGTSFTAQKAVRKNIPVQIVRISGMFLPPPKNMPLTSPMKGAVSYDHQNTNN